MEYKTSPRHFAQLVAALREQSPQRPARPSVVARLQQIGVDRWVHRSTIEDLLVDLDPRLDSYGAGNPDALAEMLRIPYRDVAFRPKKKSSGAMLFPALAAVEFAEMLMCLEALGFRVDPEPLVSELSAQLTQATMLSGSELSVFWYQHTRHRGHPITIDVDSTDRPIPDKVDEWKTSTGYRMVVAYADGTTIRMTVHAPKFRRRPEPVETTCPDCGFTYYRGDPESSAGHRLEHRRRMRYLHPAHALPASGAAPETSRDQRTGPRLLPGHHGFAEVDAPRDVRARFGVQARVWL
ncbi:hypothetical protein [Burkholderia ubonensis]|uniref:hypothetical protein n=1 Tax=Burkholderia ubonensis TaxID=101571 RepID=UPI000A499E35|nr:hypothetical protein [Burkholderia ubonensis]